MENLEQQLGAVLGNPEMMEKIMAMAQALGTSNPEPQPQEEGNRRSKYIQQHDQDDLGRHGKIEFARFLKTHFDSHPKWKLKSKPAIGAPTVVLSA